MYGHRLHRHRIKSKTADIDIDIESKISDIDTSLISSQVAVESGLVVLDRRCNNESPVSGDEQLASIE